MAARLKIRLGAELLLMIKTGQSRAELRSRPLYEFNHDVEVLLKPNDGH